MANKPGRNDPCPCGSGKKFKNCCLNKPILSEQDRDLLDDLVDISEALPLGLSRYDVYILYWNLTRRVPAIGAEQLLYVICSQWVLLNLPEDLWRTGMMSEKGPYSVAWPREEVGITHLLTDLLSEGFFDEFEEQKDTMAGLVSEWAHTPITLYRVEERFGPLYRVTDLLQGRSLWVYGMKDDVVENLPLGIGFFGQTRVKDVSLNLGPALNLPGRYESRVLKKISGLKRKSYFSGLPDSLQLLMGFGEIWSEMNRKETMRLVEEQDWGNPLYEEVMRLYLEKAPQDFVSARMLLSFWIGYTQETGVAFRNPAGYAAALEYFSDTFGEKLPDYRFTQAQLAQKYNTSPGTISRNLGMMHNYLRRTVDKVREDLMQEDPVNMMVRAMNEPDPGQAVSLARRALSLNPDLSDAWLVLADHEDNPQDALEIIRKAVDAAVRYMGGPGVFQEYAGHFWEFIETRPYMRAMHALAMELLEMDKNQEALQILDRMLELNPSDDMGVRYIYLVPLLKENRVEEARNFLSRKPEKSTWWAYNRLLLHLMKSGTGKHPDYGRLLKEAADANPYVPVLLTNPELLPAELPLAYSPGDPAEAAYYVIEYIEFWENFEPVLDDLKKRTDAGRKAKVSQLSDYRKRRR